ncbi:MAG: PPOX class F420-dependent oxidoreductase [Streptomyces sp.]|nr:PPOX class F420-dependent oxidoreductase [Streptomyces sp.]
MAALRRGKYVSVTTFRRDGTPVPTPVWYALGDGELVFWTGAGSGKVKRIRNNPRVELAPCNARGRVAPGAPTFEGTARLLDEPGKAAARRLLARRYALVRLGDLARSLARRTDRSDQVGVSVLL